MSRAQDDPERFANQTSRLMGAGAAFAIPLLGIVFVGARITVGLFGEEWSAAVPVMRIVAIAGISRAVVVYVSPIQQAMGRAYQAAATLWFASVASVTTITIFAVYIASGSIEAKVRGVAIARLVTDLVIISPVFFLLIVAVSGSTSRMLLRAVFPALVVTAATIGVGMPIDIFVSHTHLGLVTQGAIVGLASGTVAMAGLLIISVDARVLLRKIRSLVRV